MATHMDKDDDKFYRQRRGILLLNENGGSARQIPTN